MAKKIKKLILNGEAYDLATPSATASVAWAVKLGSDTAQSTAANAVTSTSGRTYAIQTNSSWQMVVNVPWEDSQTGSASTSTAGTLKLGSDTVQSTAANAVSSTASRSYALQVNSSGQWVINVPWTDTTYTASNFDIKDLTDSTSLRTTWSNKQDALSEVTKSDMDTGTSTTAGKVSAKAIADYVKGKVAGTYVYKGSKASYDLLPASWNTTWDVWNVVAAYWDYPAWTNFAWDGTAWDALWGTVDLSGYVDTTSNQTINWTKTFWTSPVVPSKSTSAGNNATTIATEAQVYKKQDSLTLPSTPTSWHLVTWGANNKTLADWWAIPSVWNATITFKQGISSTAIGTLTTNQSSAWTITMHDNVPITQADYDDLPSTKATDWNAYWIFEVVS